MACEEVNPEPRGAAQAHQEAPVPQQKLTAAHPVLCQCHGAAVCPDRHGGAVLPTQRHLQPPHHGEQVPRGPPAAQASHQTGRLPQLHHLLQRGVR